MAALSPVHLTAVSRTLRELLRIIGPLPFARHSYLADGTSLALRLGYRRSDDLDFFSATDEVLRGTRQEILTALSAHTPQAIEDVDGNLLLIVSGVRVGFFSDGYRCSNHPMRWKAWAWPHWSTWAS
jgi:hypothetical protein